MAVQPIQGGDLFSDDGAIQKLINQLKTLNTEYSKAQEIIIEKSKESEKRLNALTGVTAEQREEIKRLAQGTDAMAKSYKKLDAALGENNKTITEVREATKDVNRLRRLEAKINTNAAGSYNALSAEMSVLKIRYKQLTKEQIENSKEGKELTKRIKDINDTLKELDKNVGVHTRNVGNYRDALAELPGGFGAVGRGINDVLGGFKALIKNPIVLTLGLISGALSVLFEAFQRSEKGSRLLAKGAAFVEGAMIQLTGVVDTAIGFFERIFQSETVKDIENFGKTFVSSVVFRFIQFNKIISSVGEALRSLWQRDLEGVKIAGEEAAKAAAKIFTGPDASERAALQQAIEDQKTETESLTNAYVNLEKAQFAVRQENRKLTQEAERLATIQETQQQIADDTTLSFRQQQEALTKAQRAGEERARTELRIAQNNLQLLNAEIRLRRAGGQEVQTLLDQQVGAIQAVAQAERDLALTTADAAKQRREIRRDEFERELDFAIDFYDAQKMQLERQVGNEDLLFGQRVARLKKLRELDKSSFNEQIKLVEKFTGERLKINELALIQDERIVRERLRQYDLDDVTLGRILEILKERKAATQDILDLEEDLSKVKNKGFENLSTIDDFVFFNKKRIQQRATLQLAEINESLEKAAIKEKNKKDGFQIFDLFGLDPDGPQGEALKSSLNFVKEQFQSFVDARKQIADQLVQQSDRAVQAAENEYNRQTQLQAAGLANNAETARQELAIQKKKQEEALQQQRKAAQAQRAFQTIQQTSNLITAVSKVYATLGFPLGLVAAGAMFSAFAISKVRAAALARQQFREGGLEILDGPSHEGGGVTLGVNNGRVMEAEGGEAMMILSKRMTRKYKDVLPDLFHSLKTGTFESQFNQMQRAAAGIPMIAVQGTSVDTSRMEDHLGAIRKTSEERYFTDGHGRTVRIRGNVRTVYEH